MAAGSVPAAAFAIRYVPEHEPVPATAERAATHDEQRKLTSASRTPTPTPEPTAAPVPEPTANSTATGEPTPRTPDPTPERASTSPEPTRQPPIDQGTRCAASVLPEGGTEQTAIEEADDRYGTLDAVRVFERVPSAWPGRAGLPERDVIVSLKMTPDQVLGGRYDERLRDWFRNAPTDRVIYWNLHHEPEDNVENGEFSTEQFRQAWQRMAEFARESDHPKLYSTLILMDWTLDPLSERDWRDYYVPGDVDVLAFDVYNHGQKEDPQRYLGAEEQLSRIVQTAREVDKPFAIAELGSVRLPDDSDGTGRAAWIADLTAYLEEHDALWVAYFDIDHAPGMDFRLRDEASIAAWRDFCDR